MSNNEGMDLTAAEKANIEKKIVDVIALSIEKGSLSETDAPFIAEYVLQEMGRITNKDELFSFLADLSSRWPIFQNIETIEAGKMQEATEDKTTQDVLELAKSGKIDEALNLAKTVTQT